MSCSEKDSEPLVQLPGSQEKIGQFSPGYRFTKNLEESGSWVEPQRCSQAEKNR